MSKIQLINNNCLSLPNTNVFFNDRDINKLTSKLDFYIKFNNTLFSKVAICSFFNEETNIYYSLGILKDSINFVYLEEYTNSSIIISKVEISDDISNWFNLKFDSGSKTINLNSNLYVFPAQSSENITNLSNRSLRCTLNAIESSESNWTNIGNISLSNLKFLDSNDNILHWFICAEGDGDMIYDAVPGNRICGRVVPTAFTNTYYPSRNFIKSLWSNKQDLFAYNTVNGYYTLNYNCTQDTYNPDHPKMNCKFPQPWFCVAKTIPNVKGYFMSTFINISSGNTLYSSVDSTHSSGTITIPANTIDATGNRYIFSYANNITTTNITNSSGWSANLYLNPNTTFEEQLGSIKFKYEVVSGDISSGFFRLVSCVGTSGAYKFTNIITETSGIVEIPTNMVQGNGKTIMSAGVWLIANSPSEDVVIKISDVEMVYTNGLLTKHHPPIPNGLNGSEASLQFPDGSIYTPNSNAIFGANAPFYSTKEGNYGEQNIVQYMGKQDGDNLLRLENKLNNLPEGKTLITKPTVNLLYPEMYPSMTQNWGRGGCNNFTNGITYNLTNETLTYSNTVSRTNNTYSILFFGVYPPFTNGYLYKIKCKGLRACVKHAYFTDPDGNEIPVNTVNLRFGYVSKSTQTEKALAARVSISDSTKDIYKYMEIIISDDVLEDIDFVDSIQLQCHFPAVPELQNYKLNVVGAKIDILGYEPIDSKTYTLNTTDNTFTVNNNGSIEPLLRYPQDPGYAPIGGGGILN